MRNAFFLSGGGVTAIECCMGVMDSLKENHKIKADLIVGTSGGAIAGGLNKKNISILDLYQNYKCSDLLKRRNFISAWFSNKGLYDNSGLMYLLQEKVGFEDLENTYATITNANTRQTFFAKANCSSVLASASIPQVFDKRIVCGDGYLLTEETVCGRQHLKRETKTFDSVESYDGGIYNNIPTPNIDVINSFDNIFIIVCNDAPSDSFYTDSRIKNIIADIMATTDREYRQVLETYSNASNVYIIKPPPCESKLLDWSNNLCCYYNAFNHIKEEFKLKT